jgi:hypothetical protein
MAGGWRLAAGGWRLAAGAIADRDNAQNQRRFVTMEQAGGREDAPSSNKDYAAHEVFRHYRQDGRLFCWGVSARDRESGVSTTLCSGSVPSRLLAR